MFVFLTLLAAQQAQPTPPPKPAPVAAEKPICRREVSTGSNMPGRRVCYSRTQWRDRTVHNDHGVQSFQDATQMRSGMNPRLDP